MPLVYQQNINATSRLGVWHITEGEDFFLQKVSLQREITHLHKRLQHLAGRYLLKELFPSFPSELIRIADTRKPFLEDEAYHFSISRCGDYAAVIVSTGCRVGVDIELVSGKVEIIKHKFLSRKEQAIIQTLGNDGDAAPGFQQLLTAARSIKESMFKWYGNGGVDFKEHLAITRVNMSGDHGEADCQFLKQDPVDLQVQFLLFNGNCLSWVLSDVT